MEAILVSIPSLVGKPDYAIVGGVPARVIKNRFSDEDIDYLKDLDGEVSYKTG